MESMLDWIRLWIRKCALEHNECDHLPAALLDNLPGKKRNAIGLRTDHVDTDPPRLPPRVIDVGPADGSREPYLLDNVLEVRLGHYAALSHCWGKLQPLTTTCATYLQRVRAVPLVTLPRTFRDAVLVARRLSVRYLWIDSLCIVQDSKEDWVWHCRIMHGIYGLSFLTLNASAAKDCHGGLFVDDTRPPLLQYAIKPTDCPDSIFIAESLDSQLFRPKAETYTESRAWCFQETVLAPRVAFFGLIMMGWLCNRLRASQQDGDLGSGSGTGHRLNSILDESFRHMTWSSIVINYSRRLLTHENDKLPALAGIAALAQEVTNDVYIAGHWKSNLLHSLLWRTCHPESARRPVEYRAPSWSWTSVDGELLVSSGIPYADVSLAQINNYDIQTKDDEFGEISGGYIEILGPLVKLVLSNGEYHVCDIGDREPDWHKAFQIVEKLRQPRNSLRLDFNIAGERKVNNLWCLGIANSKVELLKQTSANVSSAGVRCLLLTPAGDHDTFSRIGVADLHVSTFQGYGKSLVKIV